MTLWGLVVVQKILHTWDTGQKLLATFSCCSICTSSNTIFLLLLTNQQYFSKKAAKKSFSRMIDFLASAFF